MGALACIIQMSLDFWEDIQIGRKRLMLQSKAQELNALNELFILLKRMNFQTTCTQLMYTQVTHISFEL